MTRTREGYQYVRRLRESEPVNATAPGRLLLRRAVFGLMLALLALASVFTFRGF